EIRQRIKMLQAELGQVDPAEREAIELLRRLDAADLPGAVAAQARTEIERLRNVPPTAADASEIRSYIDWVFNLPWKRHATDGPAAIDLAAVERAMDEALLGLDDPKAYLLDYVAVAKLRGDLR